MVDALTGLGWNEKDAVRGIEDALQTQPSSATPATWPRSARCCLARHLQGTTHAPTGRR
ncbi:hypothetical protein QJS66_04290 [Kocuria rhizophila]|nr:hypothetical protein QJS66_04290 [Kocuria rhizophila]